MVELLFRREDGSFVARVGGLPYHVIPGDPLWEDAAEQAAELGQALGFEPPSPVVELPPGAISDRQFAQGLAEAGLISEDEAEEWVAAGALPAPLIALVDLLPVGQRFAARMLLRGATRFEFAHPLAEAFAALADPPWSAEYRAAFWRHCATL
ncbi:hypothetical protein SAMN05880592_105159 [Bosea sp. TND4EK4]|nr:hypothetical protein SAMN05880592_105159 [Bosea sp. TND4EK4]